MLCGSWQELAEIKRVDSGAARRAFWVDRPEEETPDGQTSVFVPVCVLFCLLSRLLLCCLVSLSGFEMD